jgi:CO/xanthine dehydrogenase Mo-binding subunit
VTVAEARNSEWRSDRARVTGRARYSADVECPDALHAAFLLSQERHARIVSIDVSEAEALAGVEAVLTGADIGTRLFGRSLRDYPILAVDRVLFIGQRVAAVAAVDVETARRALELIQVEYEPLDAIVDLDQAFSDDAPILHPDLLQYEGVEPDHPEGNYQGGVASRQGDDIDTAFVACDEVIENVFSFDRNHCAPLETHACLVVPGDDQTVIYSAHKEPYGLRRSLAYLTGQSEEHFVVAPISIGGDFGAKAVPYMEATCYLLARKTARPVRASMNYFEELTSTAGRHPGRMRLRTGLRDGRMHAFEMEVLTDGGAFAGLKPLSTRTVNFVGLPMAHYDIPNTDERLVAVYTNSLPAGHVRSPGEFKSVFAGESHVDILARACGVDPIDLRLSHVHHPQPERILHRLREIVGRWRAEATEDAVGIGISVFDRSPGGGRTRVLCDAAAEGVRLLVPVPDQGSGMYATFQRMAAVTLGVRVEDVTIVATGADPRLTDRGAGASRVTSIAGGACVQACRSLLMELGGAEPGSGEGYWIADRLAELGRERVSTRGEVSTTQRGTPSFGGMAVQLHVDRDTGRIDLLRAHIVIDGGEVWNPVGYRGQLEGGFVYGLSQTLYEDLVVEDGQVVAASLGDYKLACVADVPPLEIDMLPPLDADRGADEIRGGVGELTNIGVPGAVANAIDDAVGVRIRHLPITAEAVWSALRAGA